MAWWSRSKTSDRRATARKPASPARRATDPAILDVGTSADEIVVRPAAGIDPADHPAAGVAWSVEHYRLSVTNSGMRDVSVDESASLVGRNPDMAGGMSELRTFAYPLVLARDGQRYPALFDAVRDALVATPQPMQVSQFQQLQKAAVEQLVADFGDGTRSDDQGALHNLKEMLHWSY